MDSKGNIYNAEMVEAMREEAAAGDKAAQKKIKGLIPLEPEQARDLATMNRAQRRAWYSNKRRKKPRFGGARTPETGR